MVGQVGPQEPAELNTGLIGDETQHITTEVGLNGLRISPLRAIIMCIAWGVHLKLPLQRMLLLRPIMTVGMKQQI